MEKQAARQGSPNRLAAETSPYLQQHALNPVNWYPWGEAALSLARSEDKPILLSIGYSACHWCHVMAHESFEDEPTAKLMNDRFVNIKVDREERPDLDKIYQIAHQMLTQRGGGWPLTMFLSPEDQRPFFGGTYFPDAPRHGIPAFREVLLRVSEYYKERADELRTQNAALIAAFDDLVPAALGAGTELTDAPLRAARADLERQFDLDYGGFGAAPKFPHPTTIERLLRDWRRTAAQTEPDLQALFMATLTLKRMADGGLCDQLGGGFSRYSVDQSWMIPHFEKMLYDNGALLANYAQAAVATGDAFFARTAASTADWVLRDMQATAGGYYSSLDADSEGHEGRFYVWQPDEVRAVIGDADYALLAPHFGLDRQPNFEAQAWHLHTFKSVEDIAAETSLAVAAVQERLDTARRRLLEVRRQRIWPGRDEKILTSWNALMIRGMAIAARALDRSDLAESATSALDFLRAQLWRDGRLLATHKDGRSQHAAYLDDYAMLADAVLELAQVRWRSNEIEFACALLDVLLEHFEDRENGGFFFTADDHERLIHRAKGFADDATPSGNGIAAFVLQRMGYLLGEPRYLIAAERSLRAGWQPMERYPSGHMSMLTALEEYRSPPQTVILRGPTPQIVRWQRELHRLYAPQRMVISIPSDAIDLPAGLAAKRSADTAVAYVCAGTICSAPIDSLAALVRNLRLQIDSVVELQGGPAE